MNRQRTINRFKDRFKISITPIPRVKLKVIFRPDGSWCVDFGYKSQEYLRKTGQLYDENGKFKYKGKYSFWGGQDYVVHHMWRYIQKQACHNNIHELDLA